MERKTCRACLGSNLVQFFDMGEMPLANALLDSPDQPEKRYPLKLNYCNDCGMVQTSYVVPAGEMYTGAYPFQTGSSRRMVEHYVKQISDGIEKYCPQSPRRVVEIGCNDALALSRVSSVYGGNFVGIDPSSHSVDNARIIPERFTEELATHLQVWDGSAHLIVANNVLGHVDDLDDFLRGVKHLLHPDGAFVFEVPYWPQTCSDAAYSQVYSEHLSYWSYLPLGIALMRNGLKIVDIKGVEVHGGSVRFTVRHGEIRPDGYEKFPPESWFPLEACQKFADRTNWAGVELEGEIDSRLNAGKHVIAYGASAKGTVVLNYAGIGTTRIPFVIDSTPCKQGKYMPGTRQQIVAPESVNLNDYDAILQLGWAHDAEIKAKHPEFKGEWIMPHGVM